MSLQQIIQSLFDDLRPSRITLRQPSDSDIFPVTNEVTGEGVHSIVGMATPNMPKQPIVLRVTSGEQVVQTDCVGDYPDDDAYQTMLEMYGGMQAQIVTPVLRDGKTVAIISVHQCGRKRDWTEAEAARCREAAAQVLAELDAAAS